MRHLLYFLSFLLLINQDTYAQTDTITIKKNWAGTTFRKDNKLLTTRKIENIIKADDEALRELRRSKAPQTIAIVCAMTGGALIGYGIGSEITSREANAVMIGAGIALGGIAFPIAFSAERRVRRAVEMYNRHQTKTTFNERERALYIAVSGNSIGIKLIF